MNMNDIDYILSQTDDVSPITLELLMTYYG